MILRAYKSNGRLGTLVGRLVDEYTGIDDGRVDGQLDG